MFIVPNIEKYFVYDLNLKKSFYIGNKKEFILFLYSLTPTEVFNIANNVPFRQREKELLNYTKCNFNENNNAAYYVIIDDYNNKVLYEKRKYIFFDDKYAIIDVRKFLPELFRFYYQRQEKLKKSSFKNKKWPKGVRFRVDPFPGTGHTHKYFGAEESRIKNILHNLRLQTDSEYGCFVRNKTKVGHFYYEKLRSDYRNHNWKQNKKIKKQYQKNIKAS